MRLSERLDETIDYLSRETPADGAVLDAVYVDMLVEVTRELSATAGASVTAATVMSRGRVSHTEAIVMQVLSAAERAGAIRRVRPDVWEAANPALLNAATFAEDVGRLKRRLTIAGRPVPAPQQTAEPSREAATLLSVRDAAKSLGVCEKTLWSMTDRGDLPAVRIGRSVRYDPADVNRWVAGNKLKGSNV